MGVETEQLTELAFRERLEELKQTVLPRVQNRTRIADIDRAHLEAPKREVRKQIIDIRARELHGRRRVVVERRVWERLEPVREERGDPGDVHVWLGEGVEQAFVWDVYFCDAQDVVDVGDDGDALGGHEDGGAVTGTFVESLD